MPGAGRTPLSWNTHALLTRFALRSGAWDFLDVKSPVVRLEDFLFAAGSRLSPVLSRYGQALAAKGCKAVSGREAKGDISTETGFLEALRLNPTYPFHYVRERKAREVSPDTPHNAGRSGPPAAAYVPTAHDEPISARRILSTFSDEPDWGMDQDLFVIERYGYGAQPYGPLTGLSSQAPFHMAFLFEPTALLWAMPGLKRNFMEERVRVFLALAELAFASGVDYWGWRFTAWAMHYLQDLTQPYHARALPFPLIRILKRVITAGRSPGFVERHGNLLRNRHMLFEAAAHFLLNDALKKGSHRRLVRALSRGGDVQGNSVQAIMRQCARVVSPVAPRVNVALEKLMEEPRLNDPTYSLDTDFDYRIDRTIPQAARERPKSYERFLTLLAACLAEAGKVTRYIVRTAVSMVDASRA